MRPPYFSKITYPHFAQNLKALRLIHGFTQKRLANKIGVSEMTISNWECGNTTPEHGMLFKLAFLFGEDIDDILYEKKNYVTELEKIKGKSNAVT